MSGFVEGLLRYGGILLLLIGVALLVSLLVGGRLTSLRPPQRDDNGSVEAAEADEPDDSDEVAEEPDDAEEPEEAEPDKPRPKGRRR